jgi:hypothetical protein
LALLVEFDRLVKVAVVALVLVGEGDVESLLETVAEELADDRDTVLAERGREVSEEATVEDKREELKPSERVDEEAVDTSSVPYGVVKVNEGVDDAVSCNNDVDESAVDVELSIYVSTPHYTVRSRIPHNLKASVIVFQ